MTAQDVADLFRDLELRLIGSLKRNLRRHKRQEEQEGGQGGVPEQWEAWQSAKLRDLQRFRKENEQIVGAVSPAIDQGTKELIREQYGEGGSDGFFHMNDRRVKTLLEEMENVQAQVEKAALRYMDDVYRRTVQGAALNMATGSMTMQQAVDMATKDFLAAGITCIQYRNGRRVNIASYAEMALRTAATRATLQGEAALREQLGIDTVLVSQYGACSDTCLPWQGLVYIDDVFQAYSGPHTPGGTYGVSRNGRQYPLLSVAVRAGLFHPNCRHTLTTWNEGVSRRPKPMDKAKIEATSRLESRQRYLERRVREAKRRAEGLLDPEAAKEAKRLVRRRQAELKEFVEAHGDVLRRDPWRERYDQTMPAEKLLARGSGGASDLSNGQTIHQMLGRIDPKDTEKREALLQTFCQRYANSPVENMLVITKDGEVHFMTDNSPKGVDCSYLGDKLVDSWNIHTHPPDSTQFSFSTDVDLPAFFADGSAVMEAVDYKYRYRFKRPKNITFEQWDAERYAVECQIESILAQKGMGLEDYEENRQHSILVETCKRLNISCYERWKL